jgi:hypothetical protein
MTDSRRLGHFITIAAAVAGLALFAYSLRQAGVSQIVEHVKGIGWGLVLILLLAGVRFMLRAEAWRLCTPVGSRLTLWQAFMAFVAGDALGNITPLGLIASEPTKVFLTRHHLATRQSIASLAADNLVYVLSVVAMIALGLGLTLATVPLSFEAREGITVTLVVLGLVCAGVLAVLRMRQPATNGRLRRLNRLTSVWQSVSELSAGHPARLLRAFAFDLLFHAVAILETFLALGWLLGDRAPSLAEAIMFESLNRVITVAFKFVPLRVGIDEVASGAFASLIGLNPAYGVALAVVRKVRNLFWMGAGLALIGVHHAQDAPRPQPQRAVDPTPTSEHAHLRPQPTGPGALSPFSVDSGSIPGLKRQRLEQDSSTI